MSDYVVSARKYRPQTFDTVVGQKSITTTLRSAITTDHLAQAFLFCGTRGVGKTTTARILAKTINCMDRGENVEACDKCDSCVSFNENASLNIYELDAASNNSVDDIRELINQVRVPPQLGTHKVYIIDEVHMLSTQAFNAFLKTLEEPPKHAIFILATTEKHKIIPTILSRCQIFDFNRIKVSDMANHLANIAAKENITADPEALHLISQKADGALRDALSIFDQIVTFAGNNITYKQVLENLNILDYDYYFRIVDVASKEDIPAALLLLNDVVEKGFDPHHFATGLANHYRDLLVCKDPRTSKLLEVAENVEQKYLEQSKEIDPNYLLRAIAVLSKVDIEYKTAKNSRLLVEVGLMQLCSLKSELEKKKSLTDPVKIIAFKGQSLRDAAPKPIAKTNVTERPVYDPPITKLKTLVTPTGQLKTQNPSIKQILKDEEENSKVIPNEDLPRESFSSDQLRMYWRQYAYQAKEQAQETLYNAMVKREPIIAEGNLIRIEVDNAVQMNMIDASRQKMTNFFREHLKNFDIQLDCFVTENEDSEQQFQPPKDQFNTLARKYPNLHTFKSSFNLDFDY